MGDRVAVMRKGELQQVDDPQTLYDRPVNLFVGGFIGSPAMNMLEATVERQNGGVALDLGGDQKLALDARTSLGTPGARGLRRAAGDPRDQARGPRGGEPRRRDAARPAPDRARRAARGARLGADGAFRAPGGQRSPRRRRRRSSPTRRASRAASSTAGALIVGRFGARRACRRARTSRRPSTRARCTSSTRRPGLASMTHHQRKEPHREEALLLGAGIAGNRSSRSPLSPRPRAAAVEEGRGRRRRPGTRPSPARSPSTASGPDRRPPPSAR